MQPSKQHIWGRPSVLEIDNLHVAYGRATVLYGVSLMVEAGEILCLLGRNGAGKSTTLKSIMGQLPIAEGVVTLDGVEISSLPAHDIPKQRIGYVPQGRRLFPELSVSENIEMGLMACNEGADTREWVLDIFPLLRARLGQRANTLSGGEQQMLATARALCLRPKLLLLDEPTEGLQPSMIEKIREVVARMKSEGVAVILVEQRVDAVLAIADKVTFIGNGHNLETVSADHLRDHPELFRQHLGV